MMRKMNINMIKVVRLIIFLSFISFSFSSEAQLVAHFSVDKHSGCASLDVHFTDSSTGGANKYHWVFDNLLPSDTSDSKNTEWIYNTPGHYNVKLVIHDTTTGASDSITINNEIYVAAQPVVRFTASDTVLSCPPQTITFTNTSDTGGCSPVYTWFIDTSSSIHTANATYTFTHSGSYNITLEEADGCGCNGILTKTAYIKMDTVPAVCFTANDSVICSPPASVCFNNCTSGAVNYLWHFGDGSTSTLSAPCHTYTAAGNFTDTLTATAPDGCAASFVKPGYIEISDFALGFYTVPAHACINSSMTFNDTTAGTNFHHWHFSAAVSDTSDLVSPVHTFTATGIYTVKDSIWNSSGCHGLSIDTIVVRAKPVVTFSASNTYRCTPNDTVNFTSAITDAAGIAYKVWHFGDAGSGIYNIAYSDSTHVYTTTGSFTPLLVVTDSNGCVTRDSVLNDIKINAPTGTITVTKDSGCAPYPIHYTTSIAPAVIYFTDSVTFGDGSASYTGLDSGTHTYTVAGHYTIHQYYHLATGCSYSDSIKVLIGNQPLYSIVITPDTVCQNTSIKFKGNCTTCTHESWSVNGNFSTSDSTTNEYNTGGIKQVTYTANSGGCVDTLKDSLYIYSPSAAFTASVTSCSDRDAYSFTNNSVGATNYYWTFGDGDTSTSFAPSHTYSVDGSYTVVLLDSQTIASGGHGCIITDTAFITIAPFSGTIHVNDTVACKSQSLTFTGPLTSTATKYGEYIWHFGDGTTSTSPTTPTGVVTNTVTHTYAALGTYRDTLIIRNASGCLDTLPPDSVRIIVPSGFNNTSMTGCAPFTANFVDLNNDIAGIKSRHWIWYTGSASTHVISADTSYLYPEGIYQAVLTDTDNANCWVRDTIQINSVKPHAYFTSADTVACTNVQITFTDTNSNAVYYWRFGDGTGDTTLGPIATHTYTANGSYSDSVVIVTTAGGAYPAGCTDNYHRTGYISVSASSINTAFTLSDTFATCPPLYVLPVTPSDGNYHLWRFGTDSSTAYSLSPSAPVYGYTYPGVYNITLVDSNSLGCKDSLTRSVTVLGPTGTISILSDTGCAGFSVTLHVTNTGAEVLDTPYTWSLPPYGVFNTDTPGIIQPYTDTGKWNPFVIIQSGGCHVTVHTTDSIQVFDPEISVNQPTLKCKYDSRTLTVSGVVSDYTWSPGYGLSCTSCTSTIATPTITTTYTVTGINRHTCSNTATTTVIVDAPPVMSISGTDHICTGLADTLVASGISGPYSWLPSDSVSCISCDTVIISPLVSQLFTVLAVDTNSCADSARIMILVDSLPVVKVTPADTSICIGSSVIITTTGATVYNWLPLTGLSCNSCSVTTSSPVNTVVYTLTGTDANGCINSANATITVDQLPDAGTVTGLATICAGATQLYADTVTGGVWSSSNTSAATINSLGDLTGIEAGIDTVKYQLINSCGYKDAEMVVNVEQNPGAHITTHSFADACSNTLYQNFGTDIVPPAGV